MIVIKIHRSGYVSEEIELSPRPEYGLKFDTMKQAEEWLTHSEFKNEISLLEEVDE